MKKYLSLLGLVVALSQPSFAQSVCDPCNPCQPRAQLIQIPAIQSSPVITGAACPVMQQCAPAQVMTKDCDYCNPCNRRRGFWANFFSF